MVADSWFDQRTDSWLYQRVVEQIPLAVTVWQAETADPLGMRLVYVNPHNEIVVGIDLSSYVGMRLADAFPSITQTSLPGHIFAVATESVPEHYEIRQTPTAHGNELTLRVDVRSLGRRCALVTYTDITEQQAAPAGQ